MSDLKLIETYKNFLHDYSFEQLRYVPEQGIWSIGQMYDHLIVVAHEYLDSVESCAKTGGEQKLGKTEFGEYLFNIGGFPPIKIKITDDTPPDNSKSKDDMMLELDQLMNRMKELEMEVDDINPKYKVEHGGFGWLNAQEWFALVGMHFRHHLRQKYELDQKIETNLKVSHVRLLAPNVRECFLFYRDIIGLEVRYGNEDTPFAEFQTGDINLALEPPMVDGSVEDLLKSHEFSTDDQVALIFRVNNIDATYDQMKNKGVEFVKEPHDTPEFGHRVAYLRDPAGNLIEMNSGI